MEPRLKRRFKIVLGVLVFCILFAFHIFVRKANIVLLSFDTETVDSPQQVNDLLTLLDKYDVTTTFFVLGQFAEQHPELVLEIARHHEVACHTYSHPHLPKLDYAQQEQEILKCKEILDNILSETGMQVVGFRAPYNSANNDTYAILRQNGFLYDASQLQYIPIYPPNPGLPLIKISTFIVPLSDASLIYLPFPKLFFPLMKAKRGTVSLLFHPHRAMDYSNEIEDVIVYYKQQGAQFLSHKQYQEHVSQ